MKTSRIPFAFIIFILIPITLFISCKKDNDVNVIDPPVSTHQFVNYTIDGTSYAFTVPADSIIMIQTAPNGARIRLWNNNHYVEIDYEFQTIATGAVQSIVDFVSTECEYYIPYVNSVTITENGGTGGYIAGNISGSLVSQISQPNIPFTCSFRAKRTF